MPESLRDQIIRHEGTGPVENGRFMPYLDTVAKWTIGYGRNLTDRGVSKSEALMMLDNDIQDATDDLITALPWTAKLDFPRKSVLINMTFNMGINRLLGFKNTLMAIEDGRWKDAHDHMLDSRWEKQVGPRAIELARQMLTGEMGEA